MDRRSRLHALNIRAMARKYGESLGKDINDLNLVVAHMGGGISIVPIKNGKMIDTNDANDGGPFSPQRAGTLPSTLLVKLCFSGKYESAADLNSVLTKKSGLLAYLGSDDGRVVRHQALTMMIPLTVPAIVEGENADTWRIQQRRNVSENSFSGTLISSIL